MNKLYIKIWQKSDTKWYWLFIKYDTFDIDFYSLAETLRPNTLLKIIKSQCALCIISKSHYGCDLLRGWVCLWGLLSIFKIECRPARCSLSKVLRHLSVLTNIPIYQHNQFFLLSQPHPLLKDCGLICISWIVVQSYLRVRNFQAFIPPCISLYSNKSVFRV